MDFPVPSIGRVVHLFIPECGFSPAVITYVHTERDPFASVDLCVLYRDRVPMPLLQVPHEACGPAGGITWCWPPHVPPITLDDIGEEQVSH